MHIWRSMSDGRTLSCYDYVNRPYRAVRDALRADAPGILGNATRAATSRAEAIVANLRAQVGPLEIGADVEIDVEDPIEEAADGTEVRTRLALRWKAVRGASLFPVMEGQLLVYPLTSTETQLELRGSYRPPLGVLGTVIDGMAMHRIAEASVLRFLNDLARYLGATLPE